MTTKLAAKLPKDRDINGLNAGEAAFLARPMDQVVVVAYVSTQKIVTDYKEGGREPVVSIDAVEIITDPFALAAVKGHFEMAHANRVHTAPTLPTEPEPEVEGFAACEDCRHEFGEHSGAGICSGLDDNGDACECNEYLALCSCGHPWGLHDIDEGDCYFVFEEAPSGRQCACVEFQPIRTVEAEENDDPDATEPGDGLQLLSGLLGLQALGDVHALRDAGVTLSVVQGGVSA